MPTDAFDMAIVHRVFRNELRAAPGLVREVPAGDTNRSGTVGTHLKFIVAALHHHHMAEDELIWPRLHARAPAHSSEITRMEDQHRGIAEAVARMQSIVEPWAASADPQCADELTAVLADLSARVDEHLAEEERTAVPLINEHISTDEWQQAVARAAEFLSWTNLRLGLVLGGYVLDAATDDEGRRLMANVPLPKRVLVQLSSPWALGAYRKKLHALSR